MSHIKDRWLTKAKEPTTRYGKGLRWQVWVVVDGREKCGGSFAVKAVAERKLLELESAAQRGAWVDPASATTVAEWMTVWASTLSHGTRTADRLDGYIRNHIESTPFGGRRLNRVRPSEAQAWVSGRSKVLAPGTLGNLVGYARSAFRAARADSLMVIDPFELITLPSTEEERIVPLLPEQVAAIADKVSARYRAIVVVQAGLGLRVGEALALRLEDIDWMRRVVRVRYQVEPRTSELIDPKTPRSRRVLPLPDSVAAELSMHISQFPLHPCAEDFPWKGLLFHTRTGRPHTRQEYRTRVFNGAVRALHKADPTFPAGTTTHDLRHYYATVLLAAGEDMPTVAELLGHKDATLVAKTYGHRMPGREDRTRRAIDAAFAPKNDGPAQTQTAPRRPQRP